MAQWAGAWEFKSPDITIIMVYHILNGDALAEKFPTAKLTGEIVVIREAFMDGPLSTNFDDAYWERRSAFITNEFGADAEDYREQFLNQLQILDSIQEADELCLWFEDDLFCILNMLFVLYYVKDKTIAGCYRIFPLADNTKWSGFGRTKPEELPLFYDHKKSFDGDELLLAWELWEAVVNNDRDRMKLLSFSDTSCFRFLSEVMQAHMDRYPRDGSLGRPYKTLRDVLDSGKTNFYEIYEAFMEKEGIYGFGDVQVLNMLKEMEVEFSEDDML